MLHAGMDLHKECQLLKVIDEDGLDLVSGGRLDSDPGEVRDSFEGSDEREGLTPARITKRIMLPTLRPACSA